ncbi:GNAT family N-acetyltransferase [Alkalihalophilus lindianensis]|uniref:GNAT family N-acetyltransferase n=1 Tax=Alkalihalophilus lindianensis TaxID=1630542 RepID=A0ABU3X869_9BACI|nr:GNAT family N-acetyltransferase [Alkalihalophilus lindianensis]MDV2684086.1 GNAT family N-acetyltransferase [Alkalihalophilus lindianensis]
MGKLEIPEIEKDIAIRTMNKEDVAEVAALSVTSFGPDISFKLEHFESQVEIFPEGQICVEYKGKIVGSCSSLIVNFEDYINDNNYQAICDNGFIKNHNPNGVNLYGVEVSVHPDYRSLKVGRRLYTARKNVCKNFNLKSIILGGRIPFYYKHANEMSPYEYVQKVQDKELYDPVLTFQLNNEFEFRKVIPNYLPGDDESLYYATEMEWVNRDYKEV